MFIHRRIILWYFSPQPHFPLRLKKMVRENEAIWNELLSMRYFHCGAGILSIVSAASGRRLHNSAFYGEPINFCKIFSTNCHMDFISQQFELNLSLCYWFFSSIDPYKRVAEHSFPYKMPALFKIKWRYWQKNIFIILRRRGGMNESYLIKEIPATTFFFFFFGWCTRNKQSPKVKFFIFQIFVLQRGSLFSCCLHRIEWSHAIVTCTYCTNIRIAGYRKRSCFHFLFLKRGRLWVLLQFGLC